MKEGRGQSDMAIQSIKGLNACSKAYGLAVRFIDISKKFPVEERYALNSQIRKSSHPVSMNLRKAWAKLRHEAHFISKLKDCDGESNETDTSLDFANGCGYITGKQHPSLTSSRKVGRMLGSMIRDPKPFLLAPAS
jgi:four helix bundle protein